VLLNFLQSWASVVFITFTVRVSLNLSYFNNQFLWRNDDKFWYKCIHNCTWKFVLNLLQRRPGAIQHFTVLGRASADVSINRRWPAPLWYVTTQENILKNIPVPGRLSNSPVMCNSLKSYDVSFICDLSIRAVGMADISFCSLDLPSFSFSQRCGFDSQLKLKHFVYLSCIFIL